MRLAWPVQSRRSLLHLHALLNLNIGFSESERVMDLFRSFLTVLQHTSHRSVSKHGKYPLVVSEAKFHIGWLG